MGTADGRMEAIEREVQARLEERTGYSRRLTRETVDAARALGIRNREIERWLNERETRLANNEEKIREIKSIITRTGR